MIQCQNMIFDVDGTLWDTTDVVAKSWNHALIQCGHAECACITGEQLKREFGKPMDEIARNLFPDFSQLQQEQLLEVCCYREHQFLLEHEETLLYPHVSDTIRALSADHKLFIVSNCQQGYIELFLEKTGLSDCITDFECFGNTKKSKGENIRLLMERNHIVNACYVGDTAGDYAASTQAGTTFIFASYGFGTVPEAQTVITSFDELL